MDAGGSGRRSAVIFLVGAPGRRQGLAIGPGRRGTGGTTR